MAHESVTVSDPEILGGTPCFRGTRVPAAAFLDNFPSVTREAASAALEEAKALLANPR